MLDGLHFFNLNHNQNLKFECLGLRAFNTHLHNNTMNASCRLIRPNSPKMFCMHQSLHLIIALAWCLPLAHTKFLKKVLHFHTTFLDPSPTLIKSQSVNASTCNIDNHYSLN
jgi:hypothetical protein